MASTTSVSPAAIEADFKGANDRVLASFYKVINKESDSEFKYTKKLAAGHAEHPLLGRFDDSDPVGADGEQLCGTRGAIFKQYLTFVDGLISKSGDSYKFVEQSLLQSGFCDEYKNICCPYLMNTDDFQRLAHELVKCASRIQEARYLDHADVGALFDIATMPRTVDDVERHKNRIWRCNDIWAPYESDSANKTFFIYTIGKGRSDERELIRRFHKSEVAVYACHFTNHWTAAVVDHVENEFYFNDSFMCDSRGQERIVKAWSLIRRYYELNKHPKTKKIFGKPPRVASSLQQARGDTCGIMAAEFVRCLIREGCVDTMRSRSHAGCCSNVGGRETCVRMRWLRWCGNFVGTSFTHDQPIFQKGSGDRMGVMSTYDLKQMFERGIAAVCMSEDWKRDAPPIPGNFNLPPKSSGKYYFDDKGGLHWSANVSGYEGGLGSTPDKAWNLDPDPPSPGVSTDAGTIRPTPLADHLRPMKQISYIGALDKELEIRDDELARRLQKCLSLREFLNYYEDPYATEITTAARNGTVSIPLKHPMGWQGWLRAVAARKYNRRVAFIAESERVPEADRDTSMHTPTTGSIVSIEKHPASERRRQQTPGPGTVAESLSLMSIDEMEYESPSTQHQVAEKKAREMAAAVSEVARASSDELMSMDAKLEENEDTIKTLQYLLQKAQSEAKRR